ncbi:unnamed protein product [marine sediment metagenome]|uniref:Uncharacterized protein n=1 Tax=marine sediment metagenome TaxID=412755 RepID=X1GA73_9ZZZZ
MKKIFNITECTSDCPLRQTPAYDSQYCNFYNKDLDHWVGWRRGKKKPNFCKMVRVVAEESNG